MNAFSCSSANSSSTAARETFSSRRKIPKPPNTSKAVTADGGTTNRLNRLRSRNCPHKQEGDYEMAFDSRAHSGYGVLRRRFQRRLGRQTDVQRRNVFGTRQGRQRLRRPRRIQ